MARTNIKAARIAEKLNAQAIHICIRAAQQDLDILDRIGASEPRNKNRARARLRISEDLEDYRAALELKNKQA